MKKFDLQKALSGERVITRNGKEVTGLHLFGVDNELPLFGIVEKELHRWSKTGRLFTGSKDSYLDLFMPGGKKTMWVNIYKGVDWFCSSNILYESKVNALIHADNKSRTLIDTVPVTFEI